jgi:lipid II:glycine glycyltransferase (peptidoglycan interpeptide bridge formation enzyme)
VALRGRADRGEAQALTSRVRTFGVEGDPVGVPASSWTDDSFDDFVRSNERATYLQMASWARVKAATGWSSVLVGDAAEAGGQRTRLGARVLTRPMPVLPWRFAYAPRGPMAEPWTARSLLEWSMRLRLAAAAGPLARTAIVRMDPEIEAGYRLPLDLGGDATPATVAIEELLEETGWRRAHDMQPRRTRIVDLAPDEATLWSDLRKKWRQYVNKARSGGVVVRDVDPRAEPDAFDTFYAVMREVSKRTALPLRSAATFRAVWDAYAPRGESRLLFAEAEGEVQAVLLTVRCGTRVVEPYGGMTSAGAESRANYLLKWEAIRSSREQGATSYDMWGLIGSGIDHFKAGFGGHEVEYVGAWDYAVSPVGAAAFRAAERGRQLYRAARRRIRGEHLALPTGPGADA